MQMYVRRWHPVAPGRCRRYTVPMTEPDQTPETPPPDEAPRDEPAPAPAAPRVRRGRWWLALVFVAALAFGSWGAWQTFAPAAATARPRDQQARVAARDQRVATLKRSDQISSHANPQLQRPLAAIDPQDSVRRAARGSSTRAVVILVCVA